MDSKFARQYEPTSIEKFSAAMVMVGWRWQLSPEELCPILIVLPETASAILSGQEQLEDFPYLMRNVQALLTMFRMVDLWLNRDDAKIREWLVTFNIDVMDIPIKMMANDTGMDRLLSCVDAKIRWRTDAD